MNVIVQRIETLWTKKSRGNPRATIRNAVPEYYPIKTLLDEDGVQIQKIDYSEFQDFKKPKVSEPKIINLNQQKEIGLHFEEADSLLTVSLWKGKLKKLAVLEPESWIRIVSNYRTSSFESMWSYYKYVFNIFYGTASKVNNVIKSKKPNLVYNTEKNLW